MKPRRKPVYKWGMVNYECADYEECFAHAFRLHWQFWSCSKCPENTTCPEKTTKKTGLEYPDDKNLTSFARLCGL